jgi:hypothetical protein
MNETCPTLPAPKESLRGRSPVQAGGQALLCHSGSFSIVNHYEGEATIGRHPRAAEALAEAQGLPSPSPKASAAGERHGAKAMRTSQCG